MAPKPNAKLWERPTSGKDCGVCLWFPTECMSGFTLLGLFSWFAHGRLNEYDGEEEFWVTIKETGKKIESTTYAEVHQKQSEAITHPDINLIASTTNLHYMF